jgi:hypothetical protein
MKKQMWETVVLLAALMASQTMVGQAKQGDVIANIPFPFVVANQTLPAGHYTISPFGEITLRIYDSQRQGVMVQTNGVTSKASDSGAKIVFHRCGDVYFLSEVWAAANSTGRQLSKSRDEEELIRKRAELEIAILKIAR